MTNSELCDLFGVAVFVVGDVYQDDRNGKPIPLADLSKWFISALDCTFSDGVINPIPLADTREEAEALAVEHLKLHELFKISERHGISDYPDFE